MKTIAQVWSLDDDYFKYESLLDLIDSNIGDLDIGDTVYFGDKAIPEADDLFNTDIIIEHMGEYAHHIAGELAKGFPTITKEAIVELDNLISAWIQRHAVINFFTVLNSKQYVLTEQDLTEKLTRGRHA